MRKWVPIAQTFYLRPTDREERPDIDKIYDLRPGYRGGGGWP